LSVGATHFVNSQTPGKRHKVGKGKRFSPCTLRPMPFLLTAFCF
jgi:hypothetical protein